MGEVLSLCKEDELSFEVVIIWRQLPSVENDDLNGLGVTKIFHIECHTAIGGDNGKHGETNIFCVMHNDNVH